MCIFESPSVSLQKSGHPFVKDEVDSAIKFVRRDFLANLAAEGKGDQKGSLRLGSVGATLNVGIVKAFSPTDSAPFRRETQPGHDDQVQTTCASWGIGARADVRKLKD